MKRKQIRWSVSLSNRDLVASKVNFDRLKDRRNKRLLVLFVSKKYRKNRNASSKNNGDSESKEIFHSIACRSR
ncbi:hypothetical protein MG290_00920 [Flavobacterium sp. CBA20B-1]|uniref:hypothetical protein n=1 Tax=unclassified Flavobacterium TaxID=196869 RepID=UPI0022259609|nr:MULTISPECIES: hypothetical protein [unclassified Flavobacterium]WCM42263.1 hypothetical protein MG290_00920 [Flavobacterium sp. CBA20B-1]